MGVYQGGYIDKDITQEQLIEVLGGLLTNLNGIMNRLSSDNIVSIDTDRTKIKSQGGGLMVSGSQIIITDGQNRTRFKAGTDNGEFVFEIRNKAGEIVLGIDESGNLR